MSEHLTSSATGTLYFGYGSNLSPFQMRGRCPSSGTPIAIGRLNSWSWLITEKGYANIIPVRPAETSLDTDGTTVWGVMYNLTESDEAKLNKCEGWTDDTTSPKMRGERNPVSQQQVWKPFQQGNSIYNKLYLPVKIEKWLVPDPKTILGISDTEYQRSIVRTLIYVDEYHNITGRIRQSYVRRMGRAARECIPLGVPERWINNNFSQHGIDKNDPKSFTDDIGPGEVIPTLSKDSWESQRLKYLEEEIEKETGKTS